MFCLAKEQDISVELVPKKHKTQRLYFIQLKNILTIYGQLQAWSTLIDYHAPGNQKRKKYTHFVLHDL